MTIWAVTETKKTILKKLNLVKAKTRKMAPRDQPSFCHFPVHEETELLDASIDDDDSDSFDSDNFDDNVGEEASVTDVTAADDVNTVHVAVDMDSARSEVAAIERNVQDLRNELSVFLENNPDMRQRFDSLMAGIGQLLARFSP